MSEHEHETENDGDTDGPDLTPDDLKPGEDNPLAEPLEDDEARDDLDVLAGKTPEQDDEHAEDRADANEDDSEEE